MHVLFATLITDLETTSVPSAHVLCQAVLFCKKTSLLNQSYDVGILTNHKWENPINACKHTFQIVPDSLTLNASLKYEKMSDMIYFYKWTLVRLVQYNVIVYMDMDIDIVKMNMNSIHNYLNNFHESKFIVSGNNDWAVPLNGGLFAIKPSLTIYTHGINMVFNKYFDNSFKYLGPPLGLFNKTKVNSQFLNCKMIHANTWNVVGGNTDQGLFSLLYVLQGNAHYARHLRVGHFWWILKPFHQCRRWVFQVSEANEKYCHSIVKKWYNKSTSVCTKHFQSILR